MSDYQAALEARMAEEGASTYTRQFARHLAQRPCDIGRVKTRIQSYLQGSGGDQDAWNSPPPMYGDHTSLWRLSTALDFSRNTENVDFVLQGFAAQQSTDSEYTAASALYRWAEEIAVHPPLTKEEKGIFRTSPEQYFPDRRFLGAAIAAARLKSLEITASINFNHVLNQGLGSSHTFCDEEADEEDWGSADQDDWITGACLQLLGSWRRHRVSILGQDDQNEARVKLTPPATVSEYKWHEYVFYMFASVDEEQKEAKLQVAQEHLDALEKLSSQATSNDVRSLVSYTQEHVSAGKPDMTSIELDSLCRRLLHNWEHQLDITL